MGDMGEVFREMTRYKKAKRKSNTCSSTKVLQDQGVDFESKNNGAHLIVRRLDKVIDFWPSTGIWIDRATKTKKRGVFELLKYLKVGHKAMKTHPRHAKTLSTALDVDEDLHFDVLNDEEFDPPW